MRRLSADEGRVSVVAPDGCGCLESSIVGCLFCCHCCSSERLGSQMAFFPPRPPTYALMEDVRGKIHARYTDGGSQITAGARLAAFDATLVRTKRDNVVVVLSMDASASVVGDPRDAITLIVSHGNALDAAMFVPFGRRLRDALGVNIVLYDYSGYGVSSGAPGVRDVYADLEAVVDWCVDRKNFQPARIVLYGQSIGSAPTCGYAAKAGEAHDALVEDATRAPSSSEKDGSHDGAKSRRGKTNKVAATPSPAGSGRSKSARPHHSIGGVVLVSPIMSGLRVISGERPGCCAPASVFAACDVFPNHEHAAKIRCPTLVVHGTADVQVPFRHGKTLFETLSRRSGDDGEKTPRHPEPYWVPGAGHDDVYERDPAAFIRELRGFLESVDRAASARETARGANGADFNAVRDGAERERARRDGGAPVRVMEMTRD